MRISALFVGIATLSLASCGSPAPPEQGPQGASDTIEDQFPVVGPERRILAFGDSLFAAYNLAEEEGYPARLERVLRARGINAKVVDAGVSGDTTQAGLQRIAFVLDNNPQPLDLVIVELGGNDLLRGLPPATSRANLDGIMRELQSRDLPVLLMGMRAPPNLGAEFLADFDSIYGDLAQQYDAALVPFFLGPIYDRPELIQPDRLHPTADGVEVLVAATLETVIGALPPAEED